NFGAFVEITPGKEGLVHISKLDTKRVERVEDVVAVGDAIVVKVTDIDQQGRINLSRRDAIIALEDRKHGQNKEETHKQPSPPPLPPWEGRLFGGRVLTENTPVHLAKTGWFCYHSVNC